MPAKDDVQKFLELSYSDRQLIVVLEDALIEATQREEGKALKAVRKHPEGIDWMRITEAAAMTLVPFGSLIAEVTREAIRAYGRAKESGIQVLPIGKTTAKSVVFPLGHPRDGVVYVGHPAIPNVYYSMADFHRATFEHKFCEAIELLMGLGATEVLVEHIAGWAEEFSANLSVPLGSAETSLAAHGGFKSKESHKLLYKASLPGILAPAMPEKSIWLSHEPTWQTIAKGRMQFGLRDFSLDVSYKDDFGVNAGLKAAVSKTGLDLGGKFEEHQSTVWRLSGKFLPKSAGQSKRKPA